MVVTINILVRLQPSVVASPLVARLVLSLPDVLVGSGEARKTSRKIKSNLLYLCFLMIPPMEIKKNGLIMTFFHFLADFSELYKGHQRSPTTHNNWSSYELPIFQLSLFELLTSIFSLRQFSFVSWVC